MLKRLTQLLRKLFGRREQPPAQAGAAGKVDGRRVDNYENDLKRLNRETDTLYRLLYHLAHDPENAIDLSAVQTREAFAFQWENLKSGQYLLSDPWFRNNVDDILVNQEMLIQKEWFADKQVLDVGCGSGRWSYGFAKLGASVTAVDVSSVALKDTQEALAQFDVGKSFIQSEAESLVAAVDGKKFDVVFSWGVLHHCRSFAEALRQAAACVDSGGVLYLYLYGRESMALDDDIRLFKERLHYNSLPSDKRMAFLEEKAQGDAERIHSMHDVYAPMINRRLDYAYVKRFLEALGFIDVTRTIDHTEIFVRAVKDFSEHLRGSFLPPSSAPFWFQHHR